MITGVGISRLMHLMQCQFANFKVTDLRSQIMISYEAQIKVDGEYQSIRPSKSLFPYRFVEEVQAQRVLYRYYPNLIDVRVLKVEEKPNINLWW